MKYLSYYGLEKDPFQKEIKTEELYESMEFKQGLSRLEYLKEIKGIGLITGVVGIGKTALLRKFKDNLNPEKYNVINISINNIGKFEFLNIVCRALGIDTGSCYPSTLKQNIQEIIRKEKEEYGKETIIIIDNAERFTRAMLLDMDYLYEFNYNSIDYTSIILCGSDDIRAELSKNIYESLRQRIICMYKMQGITKEEAREYIKTRLCLANQTNNIFSESAVNALYNASHGVIRKLNTLINLSLMIGYERQSQMIDEEIVRLAIGENKL